jgi:hypothetical protein
MNNIKAVKDAIWMFTVMKHDQDIVKERAPPPFLYNVPTPPPQGVQDLQCVLRSHHNSDLFVNIFHYICNL